MSKNEQIKDTDKQETLEWIESIDSVIANQGVERAHYIIERLIEFSRQDQIYRTLYKHHLANHLKLSLMTSSIAS